MEMINLHPTTCNLCGGKVIFTSNARIYGKEYGSGKCYLCTSCYAYVGTHLPRPKEAMGILANAEMRGWRHDCHTMFDLLWMNQSERSKARKALYAWLAKKMNIPYAECHFAYFDLKQLKEAYDILQKAFGNIVCKEKDGWFYWETVK